MYQIGTNHLEIMDLFIYKEVFNGKYYAWIKSDGNSNRCYGWGSTPDMAVTSLKLRINQLKTKTL
jgi:hypothetical protein